MSSWEKENYFNNGTKKVATDIATWIEPLRKRHKIAIDKKNTAVLVIDLQKGYLEKGSKSLIPAAPAIIPNIEKILNEFENNKVIFTRHLNTNENAGNLGNWWREIIKEDDPASEIYIKPDKDSLVIKKPQYDAFYNSNLEKVLKKNNIKQVIITGLMTNLCCESTARSAFEKGYDVFYVIDAMATRNLGFHSASIASAAHGFAYPLTTDELINAIRKGNK